MAILKPRDLATVLYRLVARQDGEAAASSVADFVSAIRAKGLTAQLPRVTEEFAAIYDRESGTTTVTVEALRNPEEADVAKAIKALGLDTSLVQVEYRETPGLIGGLRASTTDKVVDVSVRRRLADLRQGLGGKQSS